MRWQRETYFLDLLHREVVLAMGCTEPAAVALACAYAARVLGRMPEKVEIRASSYILKNGMNVGIPGTGMTGLPIAAALGCVSADPSRELMVLSHLSEEQKQQAIRMEQEGRIRIQADESGQKIYIHVTVQAGADTAVAVIAGGHKNLVYLENNGTVMEKGKEPREEAGQGNAEEYPVTTSAILEFAKTVSVEKLDFLREVIRCNKEIADEGLEKDYGLKVGKLLLESQKQFGKTDPAHYAAAMAAAAADARMSGCEKPVMSAAGSGNQGLTATVPLIALGELLDADGETLLRALAISLLFTIHTKHYLGKLSVLCGCSISAAMGVGSGLVYMQGGSDAQIASAISTMVADISGVVCDGAKPGCALKIATAVESAVRAANMALHDSGAGCRDGIVCGNVEDSLANLGALGNQGMQEANGLILSMMLKKQEKPEEEAAG
ncbi:MAG TPA: serine dehydratase subunit alpha family protein [Candidatus Pullilachnospira intestinigallinarum]|nr:serine dehydratase subunit alpha family protein [Candidatus Pullilachnospira intestinigallinarum]